MKMIMIAMMIVVLMMNIHGHRKLRSSINYSARKIGRENERRRGSNFMKSKKDNLSNLLKTKIRKKN
jgi:Trp operon repressor